MTHSGHQCRRGKRIGRVGTSGSENPGEAAFDGVVGEVGGELAGVGDAEESEASFLSFDCSSWSRRTKLLPRGCHGSDR